MAYNTFFPPVQGQFIFDNVNYSDSESSQVVKPPQRLFPLNQILYGVTGTGKTYITREYAVSISANKKIDDAQDILHEYNWLRSEKRIEFCLHNRRNKSREHLKNFRRADNAD